MYTYDRQATRVYEYDALFCRTFRILNERCKKLRQNSNYSLQDAAIVLEFYTGL